MAAARMHPKYFHGLRSGVGVCFRWSFLALLWISSVTGLEYLDHAQLSAELQTLAAAHPAVVHLSSQGLTAGRREVWSVELGRGTGDQRKVRPALLVIAGLEGNDLASSTSVLYWINQLATREGQDEPTRQLLDRVTLYFFPRLNADALESYFTSPRLERTVNRTPVDDDHDGLVDEDGPDDLNADGLISQIRVEDPDGEYILLPNEPRLLIKADRTKGERGTWRLLSEGLDNDKDEAWNEDGQGGVNLNRNFPYRYQFFAPSSGRHPVSEPESRALADFLVAHPNVGIVVSFGAIDNLTQAPKGEAGGKRPPTAILEDDLAYYKELGDLYRKTLGLKKELTGESHPGSFPDWVYFHRGRLSLAAKTWSPALQLEMEKSAEPAGAKPKERAKPEGDVPTKLAEAKPGNESSANDPKEKDSSPANPPSDEKPPEDKRSEAGRAALGWFEKNAPESFLPWKAFEHPDFPKQRTEIGGWAPFFPVNPPTKVLEALAQKHATFLTALTEKLPRLAWRKVEVKHLGNGVYDVTLEIENAGYLPSTLAHGVVTREVLPTRVVLNVDDKNILAGRKITFLPPLPGSGGKAEVRYILQSSGPVEVQVISALGGSIQRTINLAEAQ